MPTPPKMKQAKTPDARKPATAVDSLGISEFENLADEILEFSEGLFESEDQLMAISPSSPAQTSKKGGSVPTSSSSSRPASRTGTAGSFSSPPPLPKPPAFPSSAKAPSSSSTFPSPTSDPFAGVRSDPFAGLKNAPFASLKNDPFAGGSDDAVEESFLPKPSAASLNSPAPIPKDTTQLQALVLPEAAMSSPPLFGDDDHDDPAETQREIQRPDFAQVAKRPGPKEVLHNPPDELWLPVEDERAKKSSTNRVFTVDDVPNMPSRGQRGGMRPPQPPSSFSNHAQEAHADQGGDSTMLSPHALQPTDFGRSPNASFAQPPPFPFGGGQHGDSTMRAPEYPDADVDDDGDSTMLAPHFLQEEDDGDSTMLAPHLMGAVDESNHPNNPWAGNDHGWSQNAQVERSDETMRAADDWQSMQDALHPLEDLGPSSYASGYAQPSASPSGSYAHPNTRSGSYAQPPQMRSGTFNQPPQMRSGTFNQPPQFQDNNPASSVSYGGHHSAQAQGGYNPPSLSHAPETRVPFGGAAYSQSGSYTQPPQFSPNSSSYGQSGAYNPPPFMQSEPPPTHEPHQDFHFPPDRGQGSSASHAQLASPEHGGYGRDGSGSHSYPAPQVGYAQDGSGSHSYPGQRGGEGAFGQGGGSLARAPQPPSLPVVGRGGTHARGGVPVATSRSSASLGAVATIEPPRSFAPPPTDLLDTEALLAEAEEVARAGAGASHVGPAPLPAKKRRSGLIVLLLLIVVTLGTIASALFAFRFWDKKGLVTREPQQKSKTAWLPKAGRKKPLQPVVSTEPTPLGATTSPMPDAGTAPTPESSARELPTPRPANVPAPVVREPEDDTQKTDNDATEPDEKKGSTETKSRPRPVARRKTRPNRRTTRVVPRPVKRRPVKRRKVVKVAAATPSPVSSSGLTISIQPACTLYESGRSLGTTDKTIALKRDPGTYKFLCKNPKKLIFYSFSVKVPSSGSATYRKVLRPGTLHVHTRPWSTVYSKRFGKLGRSGGSITIYEGTYRLLLYKRGTLIPGPGTQLQHRVTIRPGKTTRTPVLEFPSQDDDE